MVILNKILKQINMEDLIALKQKLWSMLMNDTPIEEIKERELKGEFGNL